MQKLRFEIYIGKKMRRNQGDDIVAFLVLPESLPKGHYKISGEPNNENIIGFDYLSNLSNYICDWIDFVQNENLITARIYLNKKSQSKVLKGREITSLIDYCSQENNRTTSKTFNSIIK